MQGIINSYFCPSPLLVLTGASYVVCSCLKKSNNLMFTLFISISLKCTSSHIYSLMLYVLSVSCFLLFSAYGSKQNSHVYNSSLRLSNNHRRVCMLTVPIIIWFMHLRSQRIASFFQPFVGCSLFF